MKLLFPTTYAVWDLETTGLDPKSDRVVEFAAIMIRNGVIVEEYAAIINHGIEIPEAASQIHGITKDRCEKEGKDPSDVYQKILEIFRNNDAFVTHNGLRFDLPFIVEEIIRAGNHTADQVESLQNKLQRCTIDTAALFKASKIGMNRNWNEPFYKFGMRVLETIAPGVKYNVGFCCDELNIDRSKVQQHRAGGDVELTNEIYKRIALA